MSTGLTQMPTTAGNSFINSLTQRQHSNQNSDPLPSTKGMVQRFAPFEKSTIFRSRTFMVLLSGIYVVLNTANSLHQSLFFSPLQMLQGWRLSTI